MIRRLARRLVGGRGPEAENGMDWLIVGLGNPGPRYEGTRHNVGRDAVAALAAGRAVPLDRLKHNARYGTLALAGHRALLAIPTTYMNESGRAVGPLAGFYRIPPERVLVVFDEVDLPLGRLRLRPSGGAGGHNGMKSIIRALGSEDFPRLRLGVGRPPEGWDTADHVLARFRDDERRQAEELVEAGVAAIERVLREGVQAAMNTINGAGPA